MFSENYIPRHWHNFLPFGLLVTGLYVGHNFPPTYDVVMFSVCMYLFALIVAIQVNVALSFYTAYLYPPAESNGRQIITQAQKFNYSEGESESGYGTFVKLSEPKQKTGFSQVVYMPKQDKERAFAIALIRMIEAGMKPDFRQNKWVNQKRFSRRQFVNMLANWEANGIIARDGENKNSSYELKDSHLLRNLANGSPIPLLIDLSAS